MTIYQRRSGRFLLRWIKQICTSVQRIHIDIRSIKIVLIQGALDVVNGRIPGLSRLNESMRMLTTPSRRASVRGITASGVLEFRHKSVADVPNALI